MKKTFMRFFAFALVLVLSLSVAMTAFAKYETIPYGERSDRVRKLQAKLEDKGFYKGSVDGKFGPATKEAVKKFQRSCGITADGRPGDKTLKALYEGKTAINQANQTQRQESTAARKPSSPGTMYYGCTGARVKELQTALRAAGCYKGEIDGVYGDLTYDAVKTFQYKNGLYADGLAGTKTLAKLRDKTKVNINKEFLLDLGARCGEVTSVSCKLIELGYKVERTNVYDEQLKKAVKKWQADMGYTVTGAINQRQYNNLVLTEKEKN